MYNICLPLRQVYELYSGDDTKCPLYGTSYTAVHSQESLILLCRTKVSGLLHCFIHQALTPPHLCNAAYYQRSWVIRKIKLLKTRDKHNREPYCRVTYWSLCWALFGKEGSVTHEKPRSMFGSTIATDCPTTTSPLTFQETNIRHDIHPARWKRTIATHSPDHQSLPCRHWNDIKGKRI